MPMMYNYYNSFGNNFSASPAVFGLGLGGFILVFTLWEIFWKGFALWRAAKNNQMGWFVAILLINSLGILPILYLYVFSPRPAEKSPKPLKEAEKTAKDK